MIFDNSFVLFTKLGMKVLIKKWHNTFNRFVSCEPIYSVRGKKDIKLKTNVFVRVFLQFCYNFSMFRRL